MSVIMVLGGLKRKGGVGRFTLLPTQDSDSLGWRDHLHDFVSETYSQNPHFLHHDPGGDKTPRDRQAELFPTWTEGVLSPTLRTTHIVLEIPPSVFLSPSGGGS